MIGSKQGLVVHPSFVESAVDHARRKEVNIQIPQNLKQILVDDAELVNGQSCDDLMVGIVLIDLLID